MVAHSPMFELRTDHRFSILMQSATFQYGAGVLIRETRAVSLLARFAIYSLDSTQVPDDSKRYSNRSRHIWRLST